MLDMHSYVNCFLNSLLDFYGSVFFNQFGQLWPLKWF